MQIVFGVSISVYLTYFAAFCRRGICKISNVGGPGVYSWPLLCKIHDIYAAILLERSGKT